MQLVPGLLTVAVLCVLTVLGAVAILKYCLPRKCQRSFGFFHPAAAGGGGGERVLWVAVEAVAKAFPDYQIFVYCAAGHTTEGLRKRVADQFGLHLTAAFVVVPLTKADLLRPERWPRFTLLGQALDSLRVAWEALRQVWIDTVGWPMPYLLLWPLGCTVVAYVHYPVISSDMLRRASQRKPSGAGVLSMLRCAVGLQGKLLYWRLYGVLYAIQGCMPAMVMVNSSWTCGHIEQLWWRRRCNAPRIVYPPCDVAALQRLPLDRPEAGNTIHFCSVAQFRPEKNHRLQLEALVRVKELLGSDFDTTRVQLSVVGGSRNADDQARMADLMAFAETAGLQQSVRFFPNASVAKLHDILARSVAGLHTMTDEHFGISVVDYMAAGCIPIAHDSGPKDDIVRPAARAASTDSHQAVGYLATTADDFARCMVNVIQASAAERRGMAERARQRATSFSSEAFASRFVGCLRSMMPADKNG